MPTTRVRHVTPCACLPACPCSCARALASCSCLVLVLLPPVHPVAAPHFPFFPFPSPLLLMADVRDVHLMTANGHPSLKATALSTTTVGRTASAIFQTHHCPGKAAAAVCAILTGVRPGTADVTRVTPASGWSLTGNPPSLIYLILKWAGKRKCVIERLPISTS